MKVLSFFVGIIGIISRIFHLHSWIEKSPLRSPHTTKRKHVFKGDRTQPLSFCTGNIISILMFLSPMKTFWRIVKDRSTQEFESLPYICTLLNSSLWTYYGITKPDSYLVATVNGFGMVVETIYVILFLAFAPPWKRAKAAIYVAILDVGFLAAAISVTYFLLQEDMRIKVTGFICSTLNVIMYGSPLAAMKSVVTMKSVEYMPFLLSFFLFLNGGIWTFYACLVQDWFLGVPNAIGFVLGMAQVVLYAIYRNPKAPKQIAADLEDGRPTKPLLNVPEQK